MPAKGEYSFREPMWREMGMQFFNYLHKESRFSSPFQQGVKGWFHLMRSAAECAEFENAECTLMSFNRGLYVRMGLIVFRDLLSSADSASLRADFMNQPA